MPVEVVLAFDFGLKHIGVARGQSVTGTAEPVTTLQARSGRVGWQRIAELIEHEQPTALVVGLPLNMDDSSSEISEAARQFAQWLAERSALPTHLVDERLTSVAANERLHAQGAHPKGKRRRHDNHATAACIIAESYFRDGASQHSG